MTGAQRLLVGLPVAALLAIAGCHLRARQHPCWDFVRHQSGGQMPDEVADRLADDRGATRVVKKRRAPKGWYWRPVVNPTLDVTTMRTYVAGYELVPCPARSAGRYEGPPPPPSRE